jgi:hypothetical protein
MKKPKHHIFICNSFRLSGEPQGVCNKKGAPGFMQYVEEGILDRGLDAMVSSTGCLKVCDRGPAMVVYPRGGGMENSPKSVGRNSRRLAGRQSRRGVLIMLRYSNVAATGRFYIANIHRGTLPCATAVIKICWKLAAESPLAAPKQIISSKIGITYGTVQYIQSFDRTRGQHPA